MLPLVCTGNNIKIPGLTREALFSGLLVAGVSRLSTSAAGRCALDPLLQVIDFYQLRSTSKPDGCNFVTFDCTLQSRPADFDEIRHCCSDFTVFTRNHQLLVKVSWDRVPCLLGLFQKVFCASDLQRRSPLCLADVVNKRITMQLWRTLILLVRWLAGNQLGVEDF